MYISGVIIKGFCNFNEAKISLHDGINVVIGPNNSGKSNFLRAIALALNADGHRRVDMSDIFRETNVSLLQEKSPRINISLVIHQSEGELDTSEEAGKLSNCFTSMNFPYEAQINFAYALSDDQEQNYINDVAQLSDQKLIWNLLAKDYARFYKVYRWGGNVPFNKSEIKEFFNIVDFQFLEAIRDVGRDMYMGYNQMLKDVLNFFIDYKEKNDKDKTEDEIKSILRQKHSQFQEEAEPLMSSLLQRLSDGKDIVLKYATETGAAFNNAQPDFSGIISESELFSVLKLIIHYQNGIDIPAIHNGLGYNNLIYISLLLAKMQAASDINYMHREAKLYSILAIEEPEAHLHPSMQYQLLDFLRSNKKKKKLNQVVITTHSTQIVSSISIDDLICINPSNYGTVSVGYPRKIFSSSEEDSKSKAYVQRYLDATRSDIFFANKVIFVEGIAEEILIPTFAKYLGYDLVQNHILVVNMAGRYYKHFLKLFSENSVFHIKKKIACITDIDPCCNSKACYPYEYNLNPEKTYVHNADDEIEKYANNSLIRYFRQDEKYGKTLEYDILTSNPNLELLLTESLSNSDEIKSMMAADNLADMINCLRNSHENNRIRDSIESCGWDEDEKMKALIASRYLNSMSKGGNALELSLVLEQNLLEDNANKEKFVVPKYIEEALTWLHK